MDPLGLKVNDDYMTISYPSIFSKFQNPSITTIAAEGTTKIAPHGGSRRVAAEEMVQKTVPESDSETWRFVEMYISPMPKYSRYEYLCIIYLHLA